MSRRIRKKLNMSKNRFKTLLIVFCIITCLFIIYKFNFTTKSEVEITTSVKFKEFEGKNEILANIPLLEDEKGKYIILPEKINGIFVRSYYLSENGVDLEKNENKNTIENNTNSDIAPENPANKNVTNVTTNNEITNISNTNTSQLVNNEVTSQNNTELNTTNTIPVEEIENEQNELNIDENKSSDIMEQNMNAVEQIEAMNESLFDMATKNSEDYVDKLEQIAENMDSVTQEETKTEENTLNEESNDTIQNPPSVATEPETPANPIVNDESNVNKVPEKTGEPEVLEKNDVFSSNLGTMPGEKYYLSEEELKKENTSITVEFQTVEVKGEMLYNQEFTVDMLDAVIKLTCYTPLGYQLEVKEEDLNSIQESKADVEELQKSNTILAYDIKITNGEKEFQPEEYFQVANVSITKPQIINFKSNSNSLQLLHIKETEEEINFEKIEMSNLEVDSFEFSANEFSVYAVLLLEADQGDSILIQDYESDKNYYLGKNYTDYMAGYNTGRYTENNLAKVNINYYSYDTDPTIAPASIIKGTTSNTERQVLYKYEKCLPIEDGKINVELIDNPFINRPAGYGFNGWKTHDESTSISILDGSTFVQTLQRTLTASELEAKEVEINVYVDWKEATVIFVDGDNGDNGNDGRTVETPVRNWDGIKSRLSENRKTADNASDREVNIIVLINGNLQDFSNISIPYTLTSLYNEEDYRNNACVMVRNNIIADADRQINFIKTECGIDYTANTVEGLTRKEYDGTFSITPYLSGGSKNLRLSRGIYSSNNAKTTIAQIFGAKNGETGNYRTVIESGYYNNIQVLGNDEKQITTCSNLILGSDFDRVKNNDDTLKVYNRVGSTAFKESIIPSNINKPATTITVKSGKFGLDAFDYYYGEDDENYAYTGIYVGGYGATQGTFNGDRYLIIEGGQISNIIGGLKLTHRKTINETSYLIVKTNIYVKGGQIINIIGGAGKSTTSGDRIIQVTGGVVEHSISGGSNGFTATSSTNASGELIGNTLVYAGGNATIGLKTERPEDLYNVNIGTISGAGNGKENIASGRVYTSHIIIDGNVTVNGNVYGGGNCGFVQNASNIVVKKPDCGYPESPITKEEFGVDTIDILSGTVKGNVYGGSNKTDIHGTVDINMQGGTIEGTIYGGSNNSGDIKENVNISIKGGNIGTDISKDAIFGAGFGSSTNVNGDIKISVQDKQNDISIKGSIYGGGYSGNANKTAEVKIEDHYKEDKSISIEGSVFGGGKGSNDINTIPQSKGNITVNIDGGTYRNLDVYGGYNIKGEIINNSSITVNIGENYLTELNDVYGGGKLANIGEKASSVTVRMKNANIKNAYNGGNEAGIIGNISRQIISDGATIEKLYGGSNVSGSMTYTDVQVLNNSNINNVYGGSKGADAEITENTNVNIENSTVRGNVYGGGNEALVVNNTNVNIAQSDVATVYGGGCSAEVRKDAKLLIEDSHIGNAYGGGEGIQATVGGKTSVEINDNPDITKETLIDQNVYGGGDNGNVADSAIVTITNAKINGNVFGGGNKAETRQTSVTLSATTAQNIYGGGNEGLVDDSSAVKILENSIINENIYGGGAESAVNGNIILTVDSSEIKENVYGGGKGITASTNGTEVNVQNGSKAKNVYGGGDKGRVLTNTNVALKSAIIEENAFGAGNGIQDNIEVAAVVGKSYIYADGTTQIGKSIFASGNNAPTGTKDSNPNKVVERAKEKAKAVVDIAGATIGENVYGGANTSSVFGDTVVNIGIEAIKAYYNSIEEPIPEHIKGKVCIDGTIYGGGEQMDPNKEYNYNTVSVEGFIKINIDGAGYNENNDITMDIKKSVFGSGHASRAGLPPEEDGKRDMSISTNDYITINGDINVKNLGIVDNPKPMQSFQRFKNVVIDNSALWISGATDSTNVHGTTYYSFNQIDELKLKNDATLYLRAGTNVLRKLSSKADVDGKEEKAIVEITNEIIGEDNKTYESKGNYIYGGIFGNTITHVVKNGQIFKVDKDLNPIELITDVKSSRTKSVEQNTDNRIYMYAGLNLNVSNEENPTDDTWGEVEGMTFFGIYNTTNTQIDKDEDVDITQTTDKNNDASTIHTGIYKKGYEVGDTKTVEWKDRDFLTSWVQGKHIRTPEQEIQKDGFYTNYEKFGIMYGEDEEINESNYAEHNPTSYTDYIIPTPADTNYYIWQAGSGQTSYYYSLTLIASKLSTYGTIEKQLDRLPNIANATFKISDVESSLKNGAILTEKNKIPTINLDGDPNKEFGLAMKTGVTGWSMNGETNFVTTPNLNYTGTKIYKTENSTATPTLGLYLYHSNNITENDELGYFTINMILYYWKTSTQQAMARVTIDIAIETKVYEDLGYDASITSGRQYELFPSTITNITTKSSFSAYFQLHEKNFKDNVEIRNFFSHTDPDSEESIVDEEKIDQFMKTNHRLIKTDYIFPEDTTITMIDKSFDTPTYYYYTVTENDEKNGKKAFALTEFKKMGSVNQIDSSNTAEYYSDNNREKYTRTVIEKGEEVTYQSECFIFIVDFESSKFKNINDTDYEIAKKQPFQLVLTSESVKNDAGKTFEVTILDEYIEKNTISFGLYNTDSTIKIRANISPNKIYLGDSTNINIETSYITEIKDITNSTKVYDTRYFDSKLGVKVTIFDEGGNVVHGANLLGAYFRVEEADGSRTEYYPRTDGTTRMKIADKVSNTKAKVRFETGKSTLPTGNYTFLIESFGSADGVYFGAESSSSTELSLTIVNDEYGLESKVPSNYMIIDKDTGYTMEDTTGFTIEKEYEILDDAGNIIGETEEELNAGKNDFEYSVKYSSGYENPYIAVALYRRNYNSVYDKTYSLVDLKDYLDINLLNVPDNIKEQFAIRDESGTEVKKYVGYEAYGIDIIKNTVQDAIDSSPDITTRPVINLITKSSLKNNLVSGTYKLVFTLYDKSEVEKIVEIENEDGTISSELKTVTEYQRIGETFSYIIIK